MKCDLCIPTVLPVRNTLAKVLHNTWFFIQPKFDLEVSLKSLPFKSHRIEDFEGVRI